MVVFMSYSINERLKLARLLQNRPSDSVRNDDIENSKVI